MGKDSTKTTSTSTGLDANSQQFVDETRRQATTASNVARNHPGQFFLGADPRSVQEQIQPFMDPFQDQVIGGVRNEFDHLRNLAVGGAGGTNQQAQLAGARGGSRQGVAEGVRLGALDRAQTSTISGLLSNNFQQAVSNGIPFADRQRALAQQQAQEPLFRQQQAANFRNMGLGPTGSIGNSTETQSGSLFKDIAGLGQIGLGLFSGGAIPAALTSFSGNSRTFDPSSAELDFGRPSFPGVE